MQLVGILQIRSYEKIKEFLNEEHVGRLSTIDESGFPQIIPMNFVFLNDAIYMHSHVKGEKIDNISKNNKIRISFPKTQNIIQGSFGSFANQKNSM